MVAGVGPGAELLAVCGVEARHEAVVGEHLVKILDPAPRVKFLRREKAFQACKNNQHTMKGLFLNQFYWLQKK